MKVIFAILIVIATAIALPIVERDSPLGWYVPQKNGSFSWISVDDFKRMQENFSLVDTLTTEVYFYLYTTDNPDTPDTIISGNESSVTESHFNPENPTRFVIHGWESSAESDLCYNVSDAYMSRGNFNVICVDWSDQAETIDYISSVLHVPNVGKKVAGMIDFLNATFGMPFELFHVVGHSLGAHVAGFAGKNVMNGHIAQITGLDPALPLYSYTIPSGRLNQSDAVYVETIQTCGGKLGFIEPIGVAAYYPNGGASQPGCGLDITGSCAHSRSHMYFAEAIQRNNFPTIECDNYLGAVFKICGSTYCSVRMAAPTNFNDASGIFYVPVNEESLYGKGS